MFGQRLVSKATKRAPLLGKRQSPSCFVFKLGKNLGGDGVLLILRQAGGPFESFLQQLGHMVNVPDGSPFRNGGGGKHSVEVAGHPEAAIPRTYRSALVGSDN